MSLRQRLPDVVTPLQSPVTHSVPTPTLAWHDDLLLGDARMDREHEEFVALVAALKLAPDDDLAARLDAFAAHAAAHFDTEDRCMAETDFPARACHADEHAAVLRSVEGVRRRVAQGDFAVARRLAAELEAWFPAHVVHLDSALAHWLCKRRLGGKPVVVRRRTGTASTPVPIAV